MRRRIRLRTTAPPSAFFTLVPKRLRDSPFGREKTTNCAEDRRPPLRYTASKSARRNRRAALGNPCGASALRLDGREAMTTLLAARRQHLAASHGFHARAEAVRLMATSYFGLKRAFGQRLLL
jgi:hypothetical protein